MSEHGIFGRKRKRWRSWKAQHAAPTSNLLKRNFAASAPNKVWCGDITEFAIADQRLYVATVIDLYSRRVVGLALDTRATSALTTEAFLDALDQRRPPPGLLFHSDRGAQYRAYWYQHLLRRKGVIQSMSRAGNCLDNAVAESFFATLEHELASRTTWSCVEQAKQEIRSFIHDFYNSKRLHSTLGYVSPTQYEVATAA